MNQLPYDVVGKIYDYSGAKEVHRKTYDKLLFNMIKREWKDFRAYFVENYVEYLKNENELVNDESTELFLVHIYIWDETPDFTHPSEICGMPLWRPAFVNTAALFSGSWDDGYPTHSVVHVPNNKGYEGYDLNYAWNTYWRPF